MGVGISVRRAVLRFPLLRRTITIPVLLCFAVLTFALVPVVGVLTAPFTLRPGGRGRAFRFSVFLAVYLASEIGGLVACVAIWGRAGLRVSKGPATTESSQAYQEANFRLLARLLDRLYAAAGRLYGLRMQLPETVGPSRSGTPTVPELPAGPMIILSRHGGPGDSFLLIHALLVHGRRRPRIVLKDTLAMDPLIDVVLHRVPHRFIDPDPDQQGEKTAAEIGRLAAGMGPSDALVVFPEGGNFTPGRRIRAITKLRRRGLRDSANRARRLHHVLPPRPAGVFAAIDAAPDASVVFVAHTGLDHMESVAGVWRSVPLTKPVEATWWTIPASRIPVDREARLRWLQDNWAEVDAWIGQHRG
ncbi:1-acyl-sn-glycerol-3-phosphate acyltransferase [Catenulispora rubra]|uniref:1-acyl-sn-glycerol-3-phosphate acyltransferase n=1 Tax=Catenulispora rubra TaxID=280293 RepID=UPI0018927271|nr:1-acyl-sn-glycerol-3-phosphate acyltransferase [Catenulispora rubra]